MHSNVVANLPMTFVANLQKLWRTFQFCVEHAGGTPLPISKASTPPPTPRLNQDVYNFTIVFWNEVTLYVALDLGDIWSVFWQPKHI